MGITSNILARMRRMFVVFVIAAFGLVSCNHAGRIVTDVPIKTEVLDIELCKKMTSDDVENALANNTDLYFLTMPQKDGNVEVYRSIPLGLSFNYGGLSWTYIDVGVTKDSEVYVINLVGSYESVENAKQQYDSAVAIFAQKYGKGNVGEGNTFWTDNVNSVILTYYESSSLNGADRSFCELCYTNIGLSNKVETENQPDI